MAALLATLSQWLVALLQKLGFVGKEATLVLLGLDNAGKTTLQYRLKTGKLQQFVPTERAKEETLTVGGVTIRAWDLGGHAAARHLWRKYAHAADGIVFMVDAADPDRIAEARTELHAILNDFKLPAAAGAAADADVPAGGAAAAAAGAGAAAAAAATDEKKGGSSSVFRGWLRVPVAVLANKIDVKSSMHLAALYKGLALPVPAEGALHHVACAPNLQVFPCSVVRDIGYMNAFQWLAKQIP